MLIKNIPKRKGREMKRARKVSTVILAVIASAGLLMGCSSSGDSEETTTAAEGTEEAADTAESSEAETKEETASSDMEKQIIHMGSSGIYTDMVELIGELMPEQYEVELVMVDSNSGCVEGAVYGDIDGFLYNHEPWLMQYNESNGTDFKVMDHVYYGRSALYSDKYDSVDELPDGATIAISNDSVNMEDNLLFLQSLGLITLDEKTDDETFLTTLDIVDNPKNLEFVEVEISYAARSLEECDAAIVTSALVLQAGKDPEDFIAENEEKKNYPIGLTILAEDENEQWVTDMLEVLSGDEFKDRFNEIYKGALVLY